MSSGKSPVNVDGTWRGELERKMRMREGMAGGGGQAARKEEISFSFKREGDVLKGSVSKAPGRWTSIEDGKIEGNKISFIVHSTFGQRKITWNYKGKIKDDKIKIKFGTDVPGNSPRVGGMGGGGVIGGGMRSGAGPSTMPTQARTQKITVERISSQPQGPVN